MMVKLAFPVLLTCDVDMLRCKEINNYATECVVPRRPKRSLPPVPEDKECSTLDLTMCSVQRKKHRRQCLLLPSLKEHDES